MTFEPYGEFRFLVKSNTDKDASYLVDLLEYEGNGKCDCWHFITTCKPKLEQVPAIKHVAYNNDYRCKHLIAILSMIGSRIVYDKIAQAKKKN